MFRRSLFLYSTLAKRLNVSESQLKLYMGLRIYKHDSTFQLINNIVVNKALQYDFIVDHAYTIYSSLNKVLGQNLANKIVDLTIGKVFTAGPDLESLERVMKAQSSDMKFILDYCSEALDDMGDTEKFFDENAQTFRDTVLACAKQPSNESMIAIKVSALCDKNLLVKLSKAEIAIRNFVTQDMKVSDIIKKLQDQGVQLQKQEQVLFMEEILKKKSLNDIVSPVEFRYYVKSAYIYKDHVNLYSFVKYFNQLDSKELELFRNFQKRIKYFVDLSALLKIRILIDAEQTYLQPAIDAFSEQLEDKFNTEYDRLIFNTIQNYLKEAAARVDYEVAKAKILGRPIALKMVRGAYMVEESRIAKEQGIPNPICDSYEATTDSYHRNIKEIINFRNSLHSSVLVASHNEQSVEKAKHIIEEKNIPKNSDEIFFAQLYGLSDHLTYSLKNDQYKIYKYIPFGKTEILIPYLIRRAQESRKMLSSNKLQSALLLNELKRRIFGSN